VEPTETTCPSPAPPGTSGDEPARALVAAFYRGLATTPQVATLAIQRRDLAIARQLVAAGATPAEAAAYAVETSGVDGRLAPVDLRSFERERPGWLVRHRRQERRHVDRTGLPPSWLEEAADPSWPARAPEAVESPPGHPSVAAPRGVPTPGGDCSGLAGGDLGRALRAALLPGGG
jgi:hypothetical protein